MCKFCKVQLSESEKLRRVNRGKVLAQHASSFREVRVENYVPPMLREFWSHAIRCDVASSNGGWYHVDVVINGYGHIVQHLCNCPDAQEGHACKHQYAAYYGLLAPIFMTQAAQ